MIIEEEFFEAFEIEPKCETMIILCPAEKNRDWNKAFDNTFCKNCKHANLEYPPITSDIILDLENILRKNGGFWLDVTTNTECWQYSSKRPKKSGCWFDNKKDALLNICIQLKDNNNIKQDVRNLFK